MEEIDPRTELDGLIRKSGSDYTGVSRLIGKNPAYVQQFIKRGTPRRLAEADRRTLAEFFGVDERRLGAPRDAAPPDIVTVRRLEVDASAGPGSAAADERDLDPLTFARSWIRKLGCAAHGLSVITVRGDSMQPTLAEGDEILVDCGDAGARLRDGIYVLRRDDGLLVKRIAIEPAGRHFTIASDNREYPDWPGRTLGDVEIIGRVVWAGRRFA